MARQQSPSTPPAKPGDPIDLSTSVAGEEDPGASFDTPPAAQTPPLAQPRGGEAGKDKPGSPKS